MSISPVVSAALQRRIDRHWGNLREHLQSAAALIDTDPPLSAAATRSLIGLAMNELMDANFWCLLIEREEQAQPLDGFEDEDGADGR